MDDRATGEINESELPFIEAMFAAPASEPATVPVSPAPEETALLHAVYPVAVRGVMQAGLTLQVRELTEAEAYIEADVSVLFAYDISLVPNISPQRKTLLQSL